ncbi:MAG: BatD family protein [Lentisphaeraceae bacterium]|nr:BatD family protein [Lentisphaeraceae bacterium]
MLFRISVLIFLFVGCLPKEKESKWAFYETEVGDVTVSLMVPEYALSTVDLLRLELTAEAPQGSEFHFPDKQSDYGDFSYFESHETSLKLNSKNNVVQNFSLVVEPGLPGTHKFPALTVLYGNKEVKTKPFSIDVSSVLSEDDKEVKDIVDLSSETSFSSLVLAFIPVFYLLFLFLKRDNFFDERKEFFENLLKRMEEAQFAELPKVFCEFLSENYCDKTVYTGSDAIENYLKLVHIEDALKKEIVSVFKAYEENRFSAAETITDKSINGRFVELANRLKVTK